jgi:hypothetical protein
MQQKQPLFPVCDIAMPQRLSNGYAAHSVLKGTWSCPTQTAALRMHSLVSAAMTRGLLQQQPLMNL